MTQIMEHSTVQLKRRGALIVNGKRVVIVTDRDPKLITLERNGCRC